MNIQLNSKRALVTASTGGIGFAIAKGLAEAGAEVVINGRSESSVKQAIARLVSAVPGATITGVAADLSDAGGVQTLLRGGRAYRRLGQQRRDLWPPGFF